MSETILLAAVCNTPALVLGGVLLFREVQHARERAKLLDRIMAADYQQFHRYNSIPADKRQFPAAMSDEQLAREAERV